MLCTVQGASVASSEIVIGALVRRDRHRPVRRRRRSRVGREADVLRRRRVGRSGCSRTGRSSGGCGGLLELGARRCEVSVADGGARRRTRPRWARLLVVVDQRDHDDHDHDHHDDRADDRDDQVASLALDVGFDPALQLTLEVASGGFAALLVGGHCGVVPSSWGARLLPHIAVMTTRPRQCTEVVWESSQGLAGAR